MFQVFYCVWLNQRILVAAMEPQVKKLRGGAKERELKKRKPPAPRASNSGLATELLNLWAHGELSAIAVQKLAHLSYLDGANHPELVSLSSVGTFGANPSNCHRDILVKFCGDITIADSFSVSVPCVDPKTSKVEEEDMDIFLPHLMFASLADHGQFNDTFGISKLGEFWQAVEATGDDRLVGHPCTEKPGWQDVTVPVFIHGDGVEFQDRDSILVFSWGSVLCSRSSQDSSLMIANFPKSCTDERTWDSVMKWVRWSFEALQQGKHPSCDPDGVPFSPDSRFYAASGSLLHEKGYTATVWCLEGDHEYFSNVLKLPHWSCHKMCWECDADRTVPCKTWKNLKPGTQQWICKDSAAALAEPSSNHEFFKIPGVSSKMVVHDLLHVLFTKGILSHFLGGILHYMCWYDGAGKRQVVKPDDRLAIVFAKVQEFYKANNTPTRLTNLRVSMFTSADKPHRDHPTLSCKAAESKHLLPALTSVCKQVLKGRDGKQHEKHMVRGLDALTELVTLFDDADIVLTEEEFHRAQVLRDEFFTVYDKLNEWAVNSGSQSFHIVQKFHMFFHLVENSRHFNPRFAWCFKAEDYVGKISKLANSVSNGTKSTKLSQKVALKYRHMLHLRLSRHNIND